MTGIARCLARVLTASAAVLLSVSALAATAAPTATVAASSDRYRSAAVANGAHYEANRVVGADNILRIRVPGFAPLSRVQLRLAGSVSPIGTAEAGLTGVVRMDEHLPRRLSPGGHTLIQIGPTSDTRTLPTPGNIAVSVPTVAFVAFRNVGS